MTIVTIKTPSDYVLTDWSGGKTKQLYLYPENGNYGERRFSFRLSTATVALRQTTFTLLEGYHRWIMSLDNPITLCDLSHSTEMDLAPFEPYQFEGDTRIVSRGTCQDMNLIYNDLYHGQLLPIGAVSPFEAPRAYYHLLYALVDIFYTWDGGAVTALKAKHLLIIEKADCQLKLRVIPRRDSPVQTPVAVWAGLWQKSDWRQVKKE
ncbi:HutD family protein [Streptococcus hyovaginalis]